MSDQVVETTTKATTATTQEFQNLDPTKTSKCDFDLKIEEHCETVRAPHVPDGHTFLVSTVSTETVTTTTTTEQTYEETEMKAVPVLTAKMPAINEKMKEIQLTDELPSCSTAVVPISTSLPSKLLRFHAKRSAQALLHQVGSQDMEFCSDNGSCKSVEQTDEAVNDCADIFDGIPSPAAPSMSPVPQLPPLQSPMHSSDERLVDVGMGSSIEGSEESEEDDELKPLAVDNHVLHNVDLSSPISDVAANSPTMSSPHPITATITPQELSEANLEKFHRNQHQHHHHQHHHQDEPQQQQQQHHNQYPIMDNIYLHPNFKHDYLPQPFDKDMSESSPPPAVAPANSPIQERRVHRSFLTMKKESATNDEAIGSTHVAASTNTDISQEDLDSTVNEVENLEPALIPSDDLAAEIAEAVEFYFSNDSILKDAFLLKHVRRNKEGFVSLKLVSSFKRVRQLTKDWRVVGNALKRKSHKIELNELCSKVRRIEPLPTFDETMPSRTIVACDLPLDKLSIEKVSDIFSKCGEIALIRILKPGMAIPVDVRQFMNKYPELMQKECALVEYLESSSAREAKNLQGPFQVYEMVAPKKKTGKKAIIQIAAPVARMVENYRYYNDASYERTRGGSFSGVTTQQDLSDLRYKLKRNNSDFHPRSFGDYQQHQPFNQLQHQHTPHHHSSHVQQQQHHHQQPHHHQHHHHHHQQQQQQHRGSFGEHTHAFQHYQPRGSLTYDNHEPNPRSHDNFFSNSPRRYSNTSTISASTAAALGDNTAAPTSQVAANNTATPNSGSYAQITSQNATRRLSNCSDGYSNSYTENSRRPSNCSDHAPQRRDSNCSENCPCSRRVSDFGQTENYRKTSQSSIGSQHGERRFSNGSMQFERTYSNGSEGFTRRMSNDYNCERKPSIEPQTNYDDGNVGGGGGGYNVFPRRYSNNFNVSSKLAAYDNAQYINGRRISTDSGYDRRCSFGSEYEGSPRSRTGSFLNNYKHGMDIDGQPRSRANSFLDGSPRSRSGSLAQRNAENLLRTPIGPDGSKGFGSRARKFGQTISPV